MVNYCCVVGCGRNSKNNKHLLYYGLPKDNRLEQWLQAIGREDLLMKNPKKVSYRVCSRHFAPASIKNKHLCADAVPTLYLPNSEAEVNEDEDDTGSTHNDIICDSCKKPILGFRYKCITCYDYDLCSKCEMFQAHPEHFVLRIPKASNSKLANDLITNWQRLVNIEHVTVDSQPIDSSSDDDVPITKYIKHNDRGIDLSEDVKTKIRNEVTRILKIKHKKEKPVTKRTVGIETNQQDTYKNKKVDTVKDDFSVEWNQQEGESIGQNDTKELITLQPVVGFADVNTANSNQIHMDMKNEVAVNISENLAVVSVQPITYLNFADDYMLPHLTQNDDGLLLVNQN